MSESTQHILVLIVVGLCVAYLLWQFFGSFIGRRSKVGSCCSTGCPPEPRGSVQFLPADALSRPKGRA